MKKNILKRMLAVCCAAALLITPAEMTVYADEPQGDEAVIEAMEMTDDYSGQDVGAVTRFSDVSDPSAWYYDAVYWAVKNKVTSGMGEGTFQPMAKISRAQAVSFLYNLAGKPDVSRLQAKEFSDVAKDAWYYKAVKWAVAKKITSGYGAGTFRPNTTCNRAMIITFLANYSKMAGTYRTPKVPPNFRDVPDNAWYRQAVDWALKFSITSGHGKGRFGPNETCNRAMMVTFLQAYDKVAKNVDSIDLDEVDLYGYRYTDVEKLAKLLGGFMPLAADGIAFSGPPAPMCIASFYSCGEPPYTNYIMIDAKSKYSFNGIKVGDSRTSCEKKLSEMGYEMYEDCMQLYNSPAKRYKNNGGETLTYHWDTATNRISIIAWAVEPVKKY